MKLERLRGRKINEHVLRKGRLWKGKTMMIRWLPGSPHHPHVDPSQNALYIGTVTSLRLDKSSVKRNRMRRRCREAFRLTLKDWKDVGPSAPIQLLVIPNSSSLGAPFADIQADVSRFLTQMKHGQSYR